MTLRRFHAGALAVLIPVIAQLSRGRFFDANTSFRHDELIGSSIVTRLDHQKAENKSQYIGKASIEEKWKQHNASTTLLHSHTEEKALHVHHNVSISQQHLFNVSDLDWSKRASCGFEKCFFQSKSDNHVGYLLAPTTKSSRKRYKALQTAWKLAEHLRRDYNITHFLMAPPIKLKVTNGLDSRLNRNLWNEKTQRRFGKRYKRYRKGKTVVAQQVKTAPKDRLLLGCKDSKIHVFKKLVDKFAFKVKHKESFAQRFNESYTQMKVLLHKEPCLALDFQVFVDTSGRIYHLDVDRCINTRTAQKKRRGYNSKLLDETSCYKTLHKLERRIYRALESGESNRREAGTL